MNRIDKYCMVGGAWEWNARPRRPLARLKEYLFGIQVGSNCLAGGIQTAVSWATTLPDKKKARDTVMPQALKEKDKSSIAQTRANVKKEVNHDLRIAS